MESKPVAGRQGSTWGFPCNRNQEERAQTALQVDRHEVTYVGSIYKTEADLEGRDHDGESDGVKHGGHRMEPTFRRDDPHNCHRSEHHPLLIRSSALLKSNVVVGKIHLESLRLTVSCR